jgi:mannose-1-phosphate guanylyltransferase
LLLEPGKKNTAPCIAYAAHKILALDSDACIAITPSDTSLPMKKNFLLH